MSKKTLLIIAAVAVMLMGATNAYGYHEIWNGWVNSGTLYYDSKTYRYVEGGMEVDDSTYIFPSPPSPGLDTFGIWTSIPRIAFVCAAGDYDSIFVYISRVWGGKPYGTSGQIDGSGFWSGEGYSNRDMKQEHQLFTFGGTWEATFDYGPKTYEGTWMKTWSDTPGVSGSGTCSGKRTYYSGP